MLYIALWGSRIHFHVEMVGSCKYTVYKPLVHRSLRCMRSSEWCRLAQRYRIDTMTSSSHQNHTIRSTSRSQEFNMFRYFLWHSEVHVDVHSTFIPPTDSIPFAGYDYSMQRVMAPINEYPHKSPLSDSNISLLVIPHSMRLPYAIVLPHKPRVKL